MCAMIWSWAALMPHPPIILPQIGRGRERDAAQTLDGAEALLAKIAARPGGGRPDFLLIFSPHQPYAPGVLLLNSAQVLEGDLQHFGAPEPRLKLVTALEILAALAAHLGAFGLPMGATDSPDLGPDHGSQVPLNILSRIMPELPPVILANPCGLSPAKALDLGRALAAFKAPGQAGGALLASGDLSHRLSPGSPSGFHPEGAVFDRELVAALKAGTGAELIARWTPDRLADAGVCGYRPALALMGLAGEPVEVLSYEGPFGVGYAHALWQPKAS